MVGGKRSDVELAVRDEARRERSMEKRVARRIVMNDDGKVTRTDLAAQRERRKAVRAQPLSEAEAKQKEAAHKARHEAERLDREKESHEFLRNFRKKKQSRREIDIQNTGIEITRISVPGGKHLMVNKLDGYLMEQHHRQPKTWTLPMVEGGNRFAKEYALGQFRGLGCAGFEPRVDNSSGPGDNSLSVGALLRLRDLRREIGQESYAMLELVCGYGFTLMELQNKGLGHTRIMGERLRRALEEAAAFYRYLPEVPPSRFIRDANLLIEQIKNGL